MGPAPAPPAVPPAVPLAVPAREEQRGRVATFLGHSLGVAALSVWLLFFSTVCIVLKRKYTTTLYRKCRSVSCAFQTTYRVSVVVDTNAILANATAPSLHLPFIGRREFLSLLAQVAADTRPKSVVIIVGPKSSGKSESLQQMITLWNAQGRWVVDIDLKGVLGPSLSYVLEGAESNLRATLDGLSGSAYRCVGSQLGANSYANTVPSLSHRFYGPMFAAITIIGAATFALVASIITSLDLQARATAVLWQHGRRIASILQQRLVNTTAVITVSTIIVVLIMAADQHAWREPLSEAFKNGEFSRIVDNYNVLAACDPDHRPILIVREVQNLGSDASDSLFSSLEKMKQGKFNFPVILETSDFMWYNGAAFTRSFLSFNAVYLADMAERDVHADVVGKLGIWTDGEFLRVWEAVGGHGGSLAYLYRLQKREGLDLAAAIQTLDDMHGWVIGSALDQCSSHRNECKGWLQRLRDENYTLAVEVVPHSILALFTSNVLFMKRNSAGFSVIFPQSRMLTRAIARFLDRVLPDAYGAGLKRPPDLA